MRFRCGLLEYCTCVSARLSGCCAHKSFRRPSARGLLDGSPQIPIRMALKCTPGSVSDARMDWERSLLSSPRRPTAGATAARIHQARARHRNVLLRVEDTTRAAAERDLAARRRAMRDYDAKVAAAMRDHAKRERTASLVQSKLRAQEQVARLTLHASEEASRASPRSEHSATDAEQGKASKLGLSRAKY